MIIFEQLQQVMLLLLLLGYKCSSSKYNINKSYRTGS